MNNPDVKKFVYNVARRCGVVWWGGWILYSDQRLDLIYFLNPQGEIAQNGLFQVRRSVNQGKEEREKEDFFFLGGGA